VDDVLAMLGTHTGVDVFRGAADDVLDRFVRCAAAYGLQHVIRATADNPAVDIDAPLRLLTALRTSGADYVREDGLPYGAAVEAVTSSALARAAAMATDAADREHVTPFIRARAGMFQVCELTAPAALARPDVRVTVDTPDDLHRMRALYAAAGSTLPSLAAIIDAWDGVTAKVA
jgi:spore coat polysaccharide biosynthesis protein SpsF (cytidylyltransferase family)